MPLQGFAANEIWLEIITLANDLLAWTQHRDLTGPAARAWKPNRLCLRLLTLAGRIVAPDGGPCCGCHRLGPGLS